MTDKKDNKQLTETSDRVFDILSSPESPTLRGSGFSTDYIKSTSFYK